MCGELVGVNRRGRVLGTAIGRAGRAGSGGTVRVTCRGWQRASGCRSRAGGGLRGIHASHVHVAVPTQWFDAAHLYSWLLRVNPALRSCGPAVLRAGQGLGAARVV